MPLPMKAMLMRSLAPKTRPVVLAGVCAWNALAPAADNTAAVTATARVRKSRRVDRLPPICESSPYYSTAGGRSLLGKQLLKLVEAGPGPVLAQLESLGVLDLPALAGAVARHQRGPDRRRDPSPARLREPLLAGRRIFGNLVQVSGHPRQPLVHLRYLRIQIVDLGGPDVVDVDGHVGAEGIRLLEVVIVVQEDRVLAQGRNFRDDVRHHNHVGGVLDQDSGVARSEEHTSEL